MGTRNLTCVYIDGQYKIGQYGQWDGYPEGQGRTALQFLHKYNPNKKRNWAKFVKKLRALDLDQKKIEEICQKTYKELGADDSGFVNMDIACAFKRKFPQVDRDMGANILQYVVDSDDGLMVHNDPSFALDSLFCEWAYVVDVDKGTFEVYKGFNNTPLTEADRFKFLETEASLKESNQYRRPGEKWYYAIKLCKEYKLTELPTHKQFIADFKRDDDEE